MEGGRRGRWILRPEEKAGGLDFSVGGGKELDKGKLTVARKALGITTAFADVGTLKVRIRFTISPNRISLVTSSLLLSSSVTPLVLRCRTIKFPSASLSKNVFSSTRATAVAQAVWKCRAVSVSLSGRPASPRSYSTMETLFIRSAIAITFPLTARSMGAVDVRYEATFRSEFAERV